MRNIFRRATGRSAAGRNAGVTAGILMLAAVSAHAGWGAASSAAAGSGHVVIIENMKFSPAVITVRTGERIVFRNQDLVPHTATSKPAGQFDSGVLKGGEAWTFTAAHEGTVRYTCTFHPMMEGTIVVKAR